MKNYLLRILTCLILLHFLQKTVAQQHTQSDCVPSSCGNIPNISYPFRLKDDPKYCGDSRYELACQNNTPLLYIFSGKYRIQSINYQNYTIRLSDPSVKQNDTCSSLKQNIHSFHLGTQSNYTTFVWDATQSTHDLAWPLIFLSCLYPVNDSRYIATDGCFYRDYDLNASNRVRHTYVVVGYMNVSDLRVNCRVDIETMTSSLSLKDKNNFSLSEIQASLVYGFEISWIIMYCRSMCGGFGCWYDGIGVACYKDHCHIDMYYPGVGYRPRFVIDTYNCPTLLSEVGPDLLSVVAEIFNQVYYVEIYLTLRFIVGIPFLLVLVIYKFRRRHMSMFDNIEGFLQSHNNLMPIRYSYSHVKKVTKGFREKLGQGGYGSVYKAKLRSGRDAAIKVLNKPSGSGQDFINEVATIGRIHHINIVKLIGFCAERSKCALVYDFMPNGSLEKYIFSQGKYNNSLSWEKKYDIAVGVARGIEYLHRGCDIQILHFDIKPHNILLDENFTPKISDFGLAKFYSTDKNTVTLTAARGTIGYVAPELMNRSIGGISNKADVYSFGMLLIAMVGLKTKSSVLNDGNSTEYFPDWIYDRFEKGKDIEMGKFDEIDDNFTKDVTRRLTIVALWCIQMSPDDRPSMSKVLEMLESEAELVQIPPRSRLSPQVAQNVDEKTWGTYSTEPLTLLR